jgi:hypothetical protein
MVGKKSLAKRNTHFVDVDQVVPNLQAKPAKCSAKCLIFLNLDGARSIRNEQKTQGSAPLNYITSLAGNQFGQLQTN